MFINFSLCYHSLVVVHNGVANMETSYHNFFYVGLPKEMKVIKCQLKEKIKISI